MRTTLAAFSAIALMASDFAQAQTGTIKICRDPGVTGMLDNKTVSIPAGVTYTSQPTENDMKSHFQVRVDEAVTLPPGKNNCATVTATQVRSDHELKIGERMVQQYSIAGFDARVTVVKSFK